MPTDENLIKAHVVIDGPSDESLAEAKKMLFDLLLSPYHESSHYQISIACAYLQHPMRPSGRRCICGMVKGTEKETA